MTGERYSECIDKIRDIWGEYHCNFTWYSQTHTGSGKPYPGICFSFSHSCGDGCCSWSNDHFLDEGCDTYNELADFFAEHPNGEEWHIEDDLDNPEDT